MIRPWWDDDHTRPDLVADLDLVENRQGRAALWRRPRVHTQDAKLIAAEALARRRGFTPTWTSTREDDAGRVLVDLVAHQVAATAKCVDELTLKTRVELLATAGVGPLPPRPMSALLAFEVSPSAPRPVTIASGFRVVGRDVDGHDVTFETTATITAAPGRIAAIARELEGALEGVEIPALADNVIAQPFGRTSADNSAVYVGFDVPMSPGPEISIAWFAAPREGAPPPASAGGIATGVRNEPPPVLVWEILDGGEVAAAELLRDETASLTRTGLVGLRVPLRWRPSTLPLAGAVPLRWLRARMVQGRYSKPPAIVHVALNGVWATSGETVRREVLAPIARPGVAPRAFRLARTPVLSGSLELVVDEGGAQPVPWREEPDLSVWRAEDRVYRLDPLTGVVEFGDGIRGHRLPDGFRHVHARSYRVHVPGGRIAGDSITSLVGSAPFVNAATNPAPASGAVVAETRSDVLRRGPREIRSRGRAVTAEDYEVSALRATGADVRRVHAEPGYHPAAPGRPVPGVVGLLAVPADRGDGSPPIPDEQSLRAIVEHLAKAAAPAGVDVIAAAPRYVRVGVDLSFVPANSGVDIGIAVDDVIRRINRYLHPLHGGDVEEGWPFGGAIRRVALVRAVLERNDMVRAVPRLNVIVDGVRYAECGERAIERLALIWPDTHQVIPVAEEDVA